MFLLPVPRNFFIFDLESFVPNIVFWSENLCEMFELSKVFLSFFFISDLNSDQKLAKSRPFLARKNSPTEARTPTLDGMRSFSSR